MRRVRVISVLVLLIVMVAAAIAWRELPRRQATSSAAPSASASAPSAPSASAGLSVGVTQQTLSHGRFKNLAVYSPHPTPRGAVLLLSGADGWTASMAALATRLAEQGALVVGIDTTQFNAALDADGADCVFPDGDLENLSHFVQAYYHLPTYLSPILAGYSLGATLAYATLVQSPTNTFAGAVSLGFCPGYPLQKHLCKGSGIGFIPRAGGGVDFLPAKQLGNPWVVLQGADAPGVAPAHGEPQACEAASVTPFVAQVANARVIAVTTPLVWSAAHGSAFDSLLSRNAPASTATAPDALKDLPIIAVAAEAGAKASDVFAIMLSGDGGWAGLDKDVASALTADGIPVVGLDSLRYFWSARTPEGLGADLDRMIRYYAAQLGKPRVMLIGYSQGADVLPFAVNRLPPSSHGQVALTAVMGMSEHALFEFHMSSWISDDNSGPATMPEVERITGMKILCIYGEDETDSLCPKLDPHKATVVKLKGGHHFDGNYAALAQTILQAAHP